MALSKDEIMLLQNRSIDEQQSHTAKLLQAAINTGGASAEVLERVFLLLQDGVAVRSSAKSGTANERTYRDVNELEGKSVSSLLGHGGRVMITGKDLDKVWNWLTSGDPKQTNIAKDATQQGIFQRTAGTHALKAKNNEVHERKLKPFNPLHWPEFAKGILGKQHFGANIALGGLNQKIKLGDVTLQTPATIDGSAGHLYFYKNKDGIMIGLESSAPGKTDLEGRHHDASGGSGKLSACLNQQANDKNYRQKFLERFGFKAPEKYDCVQKQIANSDELFTRIKAQQAKNEPLNLNGSPRKLNPDEIPKVDVTKKAKTSIFAKIKALFTGSASKAKAEEPSNNNEPVTTSEAPAPTTATKPAQHESLEARRVVIKEKAVTKRQGHRNITDAAASKTLSEVKEDPQVVNNRINNS